MHATKPKLLYVITKSNYGGAQRYVHELAVHFSTTYDVVVACGGHGMMAEKLTEAGVRVIEIPHFQRDVSLLKELFASLELWQLYRREKPAIVHLNSSKAGLLGAIIGRLARVPFIIFTVHGWSFHEPRPNWWKFLTWLGSYVTILFVHRAIPISNYDLAHSQMIGLRKKFTPIIYNGVSPAVLIPRSEARSNLVGEAMAETHSQDTWLLTTAELHPKKNLATAIEAVIRHNQNPDNKYKIFYCILGDGILRSELEAQIIEQHGSESVYLCGYVPNAKSYLLAGDIFLLPSKQEGLPFALLEAGAAGLPTIAGRVCGIPEVITDGTHGLLFDPSSVSELEHTLHIMSQQPLTRNTFSTLFRERIETDFTFEQMTEAIDLVYQKHNTR